MCKKNQIPSKVYDVVSNKEFIVSYIPLFVRKPENTITTETAIFLVSEDKQTAVVPVDIFFQMLEDGAMKAVKYRTTH